MYPKSHFIRNLFGMQKNESSSMGLSSVLSSWESYLPAQQGSWGSKPGISGKHNFGKKSFYVYYRHKNSFPSSIK